MPGALERLQGPDCPECAAYLWRWYAELSESAPSAGLGAACITHEQLAAWCVLRHITLAPFELDWLLLLDTRRHAPAEKAST